MRNHRRLQTSQAGFTLIELVMVIVILGVLAATALPKFVDLASDARASVMQGVQASMQGANTMIYAKSSAKGRSSLDTGNAMAYVTIGTDKVDTKFGYALDATQLEKVLTLSGGPARSGATFQHTNAATPANCSITYAPAASAGAAPTYTATLTAC